MRVKIIDYDAVRVAFDEKYKETRQLIFNGETHLDNLAEGFTEADGVIWSLPTLTLDDIVPHGRWIDHTKKVHGHYDYRCDCSVCDYIFWDNGIAKFNYCPNCGAKMDLEEI